MNIKLLLLSPPQKILGTDAGDVLRKPTRQDRVGCSERSAIAQVRELALLLVTSHRQPSSILGDL